MLNLISVELRRALILSKITLSSVQLLCAPWEIATNTTGNSAGDDDDGNEEGDAVGNKEGDDDDGNKEGDDDDGNKEGDDDDGNKEGDAVDIQTCSTFPSRICSKTQLNSVRSK